MKKILAIAETVCKELLELALCLVKEAAVYTAKLAARLTAKAGRKVGKKIIHAAAPVAKAVMIISGIVSVVSGLCWYFGRKK